MGEDLTVFEPLSFSVCGGRSDCLSPSLVLFLILSSPLCVCAWTELKTAVGQIIHTDRYVLAVEQNKVLVPPNYSRYLAWGFADLSLRVGPYESEKVRHAFPLILATFLLTGTVSP